MKNHQAMLLFFVFAFLFFSPFFFNWIDKAGEFVVDAWIPKVGRYMHFLPWTCVLWRLGMRDQVQYDVEIC